MGFTSALKVAQVRLHHVCPSAFNNSRTADQVFINFDITGTETWQCCGNIPRVTQSWVTLYSTTPTVPTATRVPEKAKTYYLGNGIWQDARKIPNIAKLGLLISQGMIMTNRRRSPRRLSTRLCQNILNKAKMIRRTHCDTTLASGRRHINTLPHTLT